jgi:hypothetical protein
VAQEIVGHIANVAPRSEEQTVAASAAAKGVFRITSKEMTAEFSRIYAEVESAY